MALIGHPFGTIKARMGATHILMKTLQRVAGETAPHALGYGLIRVMNVAPRVVMSGAWWT